MIKLDRLARAAAVVVLSVAVVPGSGCSPDAPPGPLGTSEEDAFLRAADYMRERGVTQKLRGLGEQMMLFCEIAAPLPRSHARSVALLQLRRDRQHMATLLGPCFIVSASFLLSQFLLIQGPL